MSNNGNVPFHSSPPFTTKKMYHNPKTLQVITPFFGSSSSSPINLSVIVEMEHGGKFLDTGGEARSFEFNEDSFVGYDDSQETQKEHRAAFVKFVRESITLYSLLTRVFKFSLTISRPEDHATEINEFINFAVCRGVSHLELDFSDPTWDENSNSVVDLEQGFPLPQPLYQHSDFVSLKLYRCEVDVYKFASLQSLRVLSLGWITITSEAVAHLVGTSPVLNSLLLTQCHGMTELNITTPNPELKHLMMKNCPNNDYVLLEGPKLRVLNYSGQAAWFVMEMQRDLFEAHLDFGAQAEFEESEYLFEMMDQLYAPRIMTVCSVFLQLVPSLESRRTNAELEVRHLTMNTELHVNEFIGIKFMLASCPRLDTLTLCLQPGKIFQDYHPPYPLDPETFWLYPARTEKCLRRSLTVLNVRDFRGSANELMLIKYIMAFGRRLREVKLYLPKTEVCDGRSFKEFVVRANPLQYCPRANPELCVMVTRTLCQQSFDKA